MADPLGTYSTEDSVEFDFTTHAQAGGAIDPSTPFEAADIKVYKSGISTPKPSVGGITVDSPFNGVVGLHHVEIDLTDSTDIGWWEDGKQYTIILNPDIETVDGQQVVKVLAYFSIDNEAVASNGTAGCGIPTADLLELAAAPQSFKSDNQEVEERSISDLIALDKYLRAKCAVEPTSGIPDPFLGLRFGIVVPPGTRGRQ